MGGRRVVVEAERKGGVGTRRNEGGLGRRVKNNAFAVVFGRKRLEEEPRGAIVIPLWTTAGRMLGALAVARMGC